MFSGPNFYLIFLSVATWNQKTQLEEKGNSVQSLSSFENNRPCLMHEMHYAPPRMLRA